MEEKKPGMPAPSRWENQQKAQEKKKLLVDKLRNVFATKKRDGQSADLPNGQEEPKAAATETSAVGTSEEKPPEVPAVLGRAMVRLRRDSDTSESHTSRTLTRLVDVVMHGAQTKERLVLLQWPGAVTTLALVHVLATLERWAKGDKHGLRTALYPAKANAFYPLNHLLLNREDVLRWANELFEPRDKPNPLVTRGYIEKDAFLFSLAAAEKNGADGMDPVAGELFPLFATKAEFDGWASCDERLLEHVAARVSRRLSRTLRRDQCSLMGAPATAPDALFALSYRLAKPDVRNALRALRKAGAPEVIVIDATRPMRRVLGRDWPTALGDFVRTVHEVFKDERPGVVLVADEPQVAEHLRHVCIESCQKLPKEVRQLTRGSFRVIATPCPNTKDGLIPAGKAEPAAPAPRNVFVRATDADAAKVINTLDRYAAQLPGGRAAADEVMDAANFLHRLSALPSSVRHMMDWLDEVGADARLRDKFTWMHYSGRLREFITRHGRGADPTLLEQALATADELWKNYQHRTAFAEQLASAVGLASNSSKHVVIVFDRPLRRRLAERFLDGYREFAGGKTFAEFRHRVRLILANELEEELDAEWGNRYVFAGLDDQTLRIVVTDDRLPQDALVLLTQRSAQYLHGVLRRVLKYPEFALYKPRIESMERQLAGFSALDDRLILRLGEFALPDFDFQEVADSARNSAEGHEAAYEVVLEGGRRVFRGRGSEVFLYDPANALSSDRGFRRVQLDDLRPGDRLFDMSAELRESVEGALKDAGVPIQRDKRFEASLRQYHQVVLQAVNSNFASGSLAAVTRLLRERMVDENRNIKDWPTEQAIRHWIDLGRNLNVPFEKLRPQAPLKREHYLALCRALRLNEVMAQYFLHQVILPIRNARRLDGRYVSDTYAHMLLEPESVMVHAGLKRVVVEDLFARAMDNIYVVEAVRPPKQSV